MHSTILKEDIEKIGHALSTVIQTRYVWLFNHISRALFLDGLDKSALTLPLYYSFSLEDERNGIKPIEVRYITDLLKKREEILAYSDDGRSYKYEYVREITISGMRASLLTSVQAYLEYYEILSIHKKYDLQGRELFDFIRQARNVVCHSNGIMNSPRLRRCRWRNLVIEKNEQALKITDNLLHELVNDSIESLAKLYVECGKEIDYVSLNLGYSIPFIQKYITENKK